MLRFFIMPEPPSIQEFKNPRTLTMRIIQTAIALVIITLAEQWRMGHSPLLSPFMLCVYAGGAIVFLLPHGFSRLVIDHTNNTIVLEWRNLFSLLNRKEMNFDEARLDITKKTGMYTVRIEGLDEFRYKIAHTELNNNDLEALKCFIRSRGIN
jgi:hypothetical protein